MAMMNRVFIVCVLVSVSCVVCSSLYQSVDTMSTPSLPPRVSLGIPDADHGEGDKDGGQHCDCDDVHCVAFVVVLLLSCMLPIITYYRPLSMPIISYSRIS